MRILFDTNILIQLEDNKIVDAQFSTFYRLAINNNCKILYHPKAIRQDISRDKNSKRREIIISKLSKYEKLTNFSIPNEEFLSNFKNTKINDKLDNIQLYQLYKGYVDVFVTQDKGIHKNAQKIGLTNKVLNVKEVLDLLNDTFTLKIPKHPILQEHSIRALESHFPSPFFDSLREDYGKRNFNKWLQKCASQDRKCYSLLVDDIIQAILIYTIESTDEHKIPTIYAKMLKICTLKVAHDAFGIKLGELFLNKMFVENTFYYVY